MTMTVPARLRLPGVEIEVSDAMMRDAWMAYDAAGTVIDCGALGCGSLKTQGKEKAIATRIVCGRAFFEALERATSR